MQNTAEKEEFKNYLEKSGVIDAMTKVLVGLYEESEKPSDALEFIKKHLGNSLGIDVDALKQENVELKAEVGALTQRIEELTKKLEAVQKGL
ncbi:hypothetical protein SAMD00019534_003500 [Acytostelium subglobosum LB1]|uniref:hypothetical protein n=1 Tax=Acytostelium subglobosum LB1 TaxID=1410327 RepID=UPI000644B33F|nr:hypothetical protein SAMD00019534_003500 [Acytostelium subglobosum LB1]GAM17175.1 hypothetical protein SAMD00019534_003500 [Acytostelium subglobosum LB1]|eukprot:XP_012759237.1 hypothetical protein SAMD00019534_003500 [Acytostelium subglobosum LB1]